MSSTYQTFRIEWQGIGIEIRWAPNWTNSSKYPVAHLELISDGRVKLPVTETGYRSHFTSREAVEDHGDPVAFAIAWLDHEAQSEAWQRHVEQSKQLSLF
ncbi:hypothetical protein SAMN05216196_11513 [Lutimaribacter pacificus]|uniref:Uncharacterized protein n=1 Tax=Lutimaribacter pacificus TaxID=391948 RepID=A0A1H0P057_9RHOB|nr:hypothetical protein [Lutimaribacter pacificus]SDO98301.1 hypothetical protein SAMN05216196_11513 [Lutimaribacter pacificus]SHK97491.1 hypothetical protein SAMN05444142_11512 [Lutimaribacter pacificus]